MTDIHKINKCTDALPEKLPGFAGVSTKLKTNKYLLLFTIGTYRIRNNNQFILGSLTPEPNVQEFTVIQI